MAVVKKRVPVRIQVWLEGDTHLDVRGWLDEFEATMDMPGIGETSHDLLGHTYSVKAHNHFLDAPWKFRRGRPEGAA